MTIFTFSSWTDVPDTMCTATALHRRGLKLAKGQQPVAIKSGGYGPYKLYLIADAVPRAKPTAAQLVALEKARSNIGTFVCVKCGERFDDYEGTEGGKCIGCYRADHEAKIAAYRTEAAAEAARWSRDMIAAGAIILDTETTGLDERAEIVQIAAIDIDGNILIDSLVKPTQLGHDYAGAQAIHGITPDTLQNAPTMVELWPGLLNLLASAPAIVIYNADFDRRLLWQSLVAVGIMLHEPLLEEKIHCAMIHYAGWYGEWSESRGSFRWQRLAGGDHSALGDCRATLDLVKRMAADR